MKPAHLFFVITVALGLPAVGAAGPDRPEMPAEVRAVINYLADVDRNGAKEVFLLVEPHFHQSPTVVLFTIDKKGNVTRLTEGLAPGPLMPVSPDRMDSHTLGLAVDFTVDADGGKKLHLVEASLGQSQHVVHYQSFFHMDNRRGKGGYIDMTHQKEFAEARTCAEFQFAVVDDIDSGHIKGGDRNTVYFTALVGKLLYVYQIKAIRPNGLLDKRLWVRPAPKDFKRFTGSTEGFITYESTSGKSAALRLELNP